MFERVKSHVLERVVTGELRTHDRVLSENELVREFGVSRMSVNRALKDLTAEGVLVRTPGVGTFVAPSRPQAHPFRFATSPTRSPPAAISIVPWSYRAKR